MSPLLSAYRRLRHLARNPVARPTTRARKERAEKGRPIDEDLDFD
jgi:hypothetical protein